MAMRPQATAFYTLTTTLPASVSIGYSYPLNVTVTDANGDAYTGSTSITIPATAGNNSIRIIAFYGAGNLSKSMYGRDTVILFNPSQQPITMNNWSLQTGGTTGSFTTVYKLPVATIPAGGYYASRAAAWITSPARLHQLDLQYQLRLRLRVEDARRHPDGYRQYPVEHEHDGPACKHADGAWHLPRLHRRTWWT